MKIVLLIISVMVVALLSNSCEENFSPKTDFQEKYILYSIINADSSVQTAVLQKSYDVQGFDPYINTTDPSIQGADIRIRQGDNVFFMRDTSTERSDTSRYNTPLRFYFTDEFFNSGNDSLEIIATLPGGKRLYAITNLPTTIEFDTASDRLLPPEDEELFAFYWIGPTSTHWYLPKFVFYYKKNGVRFAKEVPVTYNFENGKWVETYPKITNNAVVRFRVSSLDSAFEQISRGDPDKSSYKILSGVLTLLVFNESLSNYYSSTNGFLDDFTIRIDESDYTNVDGGLGIFGSYIKQFTGAVFTEDYIRSFGYTPGLP